MISSEKLTKMMSEFDSLPSNKLLTNIISSNPISKLNE